MNTCPLCTPFDRDPNGLLVSLNLNLPQQTDNLKPFASIDCNRCGTYDIHRGLFSETASAGHRKLLHFSRLARSGTNSNLLITITIDTWRSFVEPTSHKSNVSFYDAALLELSSHCPYPGDATPRLSIAAVAALCELPTRAMLEVAKQLRDTGRLVIRSEVRTHFEVQLTMQGWERVQQLTTARRDPSRRAFVAMWFNPELSPVYEAIARVLVAEGYNPPFRVDDPQHDELPNWHSKIDDRIIAEIRACRFVVADFTGNRPAVYYEAGFAEGQDLPLIRTCRDTDLKDLNFDTRQHEHIVWTTPEDLVSKLEAKIRRRGLSWKVG